MAADTERVPSPPPNLRKSNPDDTGGECETCTYFRGGHCTAFPPLCVDPEWVCDHYRPSGRPDEDDTSRQPRTLKGAAARAREMFQNARSEQ